MRKGESLESGRKHRNWCGGEGVPRQQHISPKVAFHPKTSTRCCAPTRSSGPPRISDTKYSYEVTQEFAFLLCVNTKQLSREMRETSLERSSSTTSATLCPTCAGSESSSPRMRTRDRYHLLLHKSPRSQRRERIKGKSIALQKLPLWSSVRPGTCSSSERTTRTS